MSANWASHDAGSVDWMVSLLEARTDSATKSSHALRRPSLEPKWWITRAALTPAALAMTRRPTSKPCSPNCSIAASRMRAVAVRSSTERMFSTLNACSVECQGVSAQGAKKEGLVARGGQQPVTERHQNGRQSLVLGDQPGCLANRGDV